MRYDDGECRTVLLNMPVGVKGFVKKCDDGTNVIILNARLTREQNIDSCEHEYGHIDSDDYELADVGMIETRRHAEK